MTRARVGLVLAALILIGCDHHKPVAPASSGAATAPSTDSEYTGVAPKYPRATLVSLPPPQAKPTPVTPAPATPPPVAATPSESSATPAPAPMETASPPPAPTLDSNPPVAPAETPPAMPSTPPDVTPPTPAVAAPVVTDEDEAKKQVVVLTTSLGRIVIQLDDIYAPRTCGNFRKLVADGFYNHTTFHRVIPNFMIQGGDPNSKNDDRATWGQGDPGYTLPAEIKLKHLAGAVAMARLPDKVNPQRDSNGSQFFICVTTCPSLDDQYTVFGHVIAGMDVATKIANLERDERDNPTIRVEMEAALESKKQAMDEAASAQ
jgi:peptidyl-prolyl cis-trans isomerase B (cyclophilin B)